MMHTTRRRLLHGASAIAATVAFPRISVGITYVNPDQFTGANFTEKCNAMAAQAPVGAFAYLPPGPIIQRTPSTDYGILDTGRLSWFSDANERRPIWYDGSFSGVAKVFKSMPQPPVYAALSRRFSNLIFSPDIGAIGWDKNAPQCNYCSRVMSFEYQAGHGEGKMIMEGCYAPYGTDAAIVFEGLDGNASLYSSILRGNRTDGGLAFRGIGGQPGGIGDSVTILDHRADGKFGIEMSIMAGAGEVVIAGLQGALYGGPALKVRRGNKLKVSGLNIEQQNWDDALFGTTRRVIDISMENAWEPIPGQPSRLNGLEIKGTVSAHSGLPFNNVIYIDRAFLPTINGALNLYSPSAVTTTMLEFGPNCLYPIIAHPPTFGGKFTNKIICPDATRPYGWIVRPQYWNGAFDIAFNSQNANVGILKDMNGNATIAGEIMSNGTQTNGMVAFGLPAGFRSRKEIAIPIYSDTGYQHWLVCAPQIDDSTGHPVSIEAGVDQPLTGATRWRVGSTYQEYYHHLGIVTDN